MKSKSLTFVLCCFFAFLCSSDLASQDREYQIKAEFLERFTRFIDWPEGSAASNPSIPFYLCIIGKNPYGSYIQDLAAIEKVHRKKIVVREIASVGEIEPCNLLFISDSERTALPWILSYTAQKPILTVSDSPGFAEQGVLINFYKQEGFIRFEINPQAVQKSGLKFSSRLLKLGRLTGPRAPAAKDSDATP